jgi:hypothetical protein
MILERLAAAFMFKEYLMASFMLLLHRPTDRPRASLSAEAAASVTREYMDWADRVRAQGRLKAGSKLTDDAGRILRGNDGRVSTTDGPFVESKEIVGGYFLLSAGSYAEACRIAEDCPHLKYGSYIEVRQVEEL